LSGIKPVSVSACGATGSSWAWLRPSVTGRRLHNLLIKWRFNCFICLLKGEQIPLSLYGVYWETGREVKGAGVGCQGNVKIDANVVISRKEKRG